MVQYGTKDDPLVDRFFKQVDQHDPQQIPKEKLLSYVALVIKVRAAYYSIIVTFLAALLSIVFQPLLWIRCLSGGIMLACFLGFLKYQKYVASGKLSVAMATRGAKKKEWLSIKVPIICANLAIILLPSFAP